MFLGTTLSTSNYDLLLVAWDGQTLQPGVTFSGGDSQYCSQQAAVARQNMIDNDLWVITDAGQDITCQDQPNDHFVTTWKTDNPGASSSTSLTIPTIGSGYNYDVDWGDGNGFTDIGMTGDASHDYGVGNEGNYIVRVRGEFPRIYFDNGGDKEKIIEINQWGTQIWTSMESAFYGCANLEGQASDTPNLDQVLNFSSMLRTTSIFNQDIGNWDVSTGTNFEAMFLGALIFNQDIGSWDVSNGQDFGFMFRSAFAFNQDLSLWDVGNGTIFRSMFEFLPAFNQDLGAWNVSNGGNFSYMFSGCNSFDQDLGLWNVSSASDMNYMFQNIALSTSNYDSLLIGWGDQVLQSGVTFDGGNSQFCSPEALDARQNMIDNDLWVITDGGQDITCQEQPTEHFVTTWKTDNPGTSNSTSIRIPTIGSGYNYDVDWGDGNGFSDIGVTGDATHDYGVGNEGEYMIRIRGDFPRIRMWQSGENDKIIAINQWGTNPWDSFYFAFTSCDSLVGLATDIPDLSNLNTLQGMFNNCEIFNQDIGDWDVSNVIDFRIMFGYAEAFNQDIGNWDVSNGVQFHSMFISADSFNQDIGSWDVSNGTNFSQMFRNTDVFDQDLGTWDVSNATDLSLMFDNSVLSTTNYDSLLIGWGEQSIQQGVTFSGGNSQFCSQEAADARQSMIDNDMWTITDGGQDLSCLIQCHTQDKSILEEVAAAFPVETFTNWDFSDPMIAPTESWQGVGMTADGCRVDSINLEMLNMTGVLPDTMGYLAELRYLQLRNNNIGGGIPTSFGNLTNLEYFNMNENNMVGAGIPAELGNMTSLERLFLGVNNLGGSIPTEIGNLTNLIQLDLPSNSLTGSIPTSLDETMTSLVNLNLGNNLLTGTLPDELGLIPNITSLRISGNTLHGCYPYSFNNHCDAVVFAELSGLDNEDFSTFCSGGSGGCTPSTCPSDFNEDGVLNGDDFAIFLGNYGLTCTPYCPSDLDMDGDTDGDDFGIFLGNFGLTCN